MDTHNKIATTATSLLQSCTDSDGNVLYLNDGPADDIYSKQYWIDLKVDAEEEIARMHSEADGYTHYDS